MKDDFVRLYFYRYSGNDWMVMRQNPWGNPGAKWFYMAQYWCNRWALYLGHEGD